MYALDYSSFQSHWSQGVQIFVEGRLEQIGNVVAG